MTAVLNAANEIAVHAFLEKKICFTDIPSIIQEVMNAHEPASDTTLDSVLAADAWARGEATGIVLRSQKMQS